ncbi:MAG: CDP-glycerol glycerophosphotransferase family protein [Gammaproteobacteria bacterium]|nr:CDP-glycerol glycerophosphotransferase family protein [Gammaproteobacteria bacterium]
MKHVLRILSYLGYALARVYLYPLYFLSGLVRRRADLWVFGSWGGHRFSDNAAAFFLYAQNEIADRVRLVWISRNRDIVKALRQDGYEAHWIWSPRGLYCCLKAGVYLFDSFTKDINFWPSRAATKVNLWSGVPLKAFERDIRTPGTRYYRLFYGRTLERWLLGFMMPWHLDRPDLIIATSPETAEVTQRAFDVPASSVVVTGFPRNDILFAGLDGAAALERQWPQRVKDAVEASRRVFMYVPTYRDSGKPFLDVDWASVDRLMRELNSTFLFKLHPDDQGAFEEDLEYVVELPQEIDIYTMLVHTDVLISDYSSIIFDYMLLDRPIVYYLPDLEEFIASSRSMNFDPLEIAAGPVCMNGEELLKALAEVATGTDESAEQSARWSEIRQRFNTFADGNSSQRVLDVIDRHVLNEGTVPGGKR